MDGPEMSSTDLPCAECKGQCCSWVPFTPEEFERAKAKHGVPKGAKIVSWSQPPTVMVLKAGKTEQGVCAYLKPDGRCSIYNERPRVCRDYGEIAALPCMYLHPKLAEGAFQTMMGRFRGTR